MAKYDVEIGGKSYEIDAPDEAGLKRAIDALKGQEQPQPQQPAAPVDNTPLMERSSPENTASPGNGLIKAAASGVARGVAGIIGLPSDIPALMAKGADYLLPGTSETRTKLNPRPMGLPDISPPSSQSVVKSIESVTGPLYEPQTTAEKYARTLGEFAPNMAVPGGMAQRVIGTVAPAIASEAAGQATEGTGYEGAARIAAALGAPLAVTGAAAAITPVVARSAERTRLSGVLDQAGVTQQTAGQRTGSVPLQYAESAFSSMPGGGGGAVRRVEQQGEQFTNAALQHAGTNAPRATAEVIDGTFNRLGAEFDRLVGMSQLNIDNRVANAIHTAEQQYAALVPEGMRSPMLVPGNPHNLLDNLVQQGQQVGNAIAVPGEVYQAYRSRLGRLARGTQDPQLRHALMGVQEAIDDAVARSLPAGEAQAWQTARGQYRNLMAIEQALGGAGSAMAEGILSPQALRQAVQSQDKRGYVRGQGDMADLARAGEAILRPLPNSGTAQRTAAIAAPVVLAQAATELAKGNPMTAAATASAAVAPAVAGRVLMSTPVQAYLGNQAAAEFRRNTPAILTAPRVAPQAASEAMTEQGLQNRTARWLQANGFQPDEAAAIMKDKARLQKTLKEIRQSGARGG